MRSATAPMVSVSSTRARVPALALTSSELEVIRSSHVLDRDPANPLRRRRAGRGGDRRRPPPRWRACRRAAPATRSRRPRRTSTGSGCSPTGATCSGSTMGRSNGSPRCPGRWGCASTSTRAGCSSAVTTPGSGCSAMARSSPSRRSREAPTRAEWHTPWGGPPSVFSMASLGDDLFVSVHVGGILRSSDGGQSWEATIDLHEDVHQVVADPEAGRSGRQPAPAGSPRAPTAVGRGPTTPTGCTRRTCSPSPSPMPGSWSARSVGPRWP